ncbi:DUF5681 domain-containing protein [Marinicaulis aureus]|uniref:DUF5681 domain-containing protein n=1 Tax=Hyphococcus aureus TaxID=2666033 RepID=A0ABW1KTX0_9PROT
MSDKEKPEDYDVGYKRPPKHTRFKKGQSGNKKGRPKGSRNMTSILAEVMAQKVMIKINGRKKLVPLREAWAHQLGAAALRGNVREQIALMKALHDYVPAALEPENAPPTKIVVNFVDSNEEMLVERFKREEEEERAVLEKETREEAELNARWRATGIDDE